MFDVQVSPPVETDNFTIESTPAAVLEEQSPDEPSACEGVVLSLPDINENSPLGT